MNEINLLEMLVTTSKSNNCISVLLDSNVYVFINFVYMLFLVLPFVLN